jgi:mRNA-degrading endonuclease toxin of MazEF toxin-antitoxin module
VNIAVPAPPGGTYQLQVACAANPNFSCPATTVSLTSTAAAKIATVTALSASSYAITAGQSVTLTASVTATTAGSSPLSGTVTFTSATQGVLGTATVTNGVATFTSAVLPAGSYSLTANYSGDANYGSSAGSAASVLVVSPSASNNTATLSATISATTATAGSTVNVAATVTLPSGTPTGVVLATILIPGGTSNASGTLAASTTNSASTTIPLTVPAAGTYQIVVGCPATDAFTCNSVNLSLTSVGSTTGLIKTTTTLSLSPAVPLAGQPTLFTATVTSATAGSAPISGTVLFFNGTTQIGSGTIFGGVASASITLTSTALASFTAVYSGDTNYAPSTSTPITLSPTLTPVTVTLTALGATGLAGSNVTLTAQVSGTVSSGAAPTGTVSFYVAGTVPALLGTVKLTPGVAGTPSIAQLNTQGIPAGTQTLYAVYSGDTNFAPGVSASVAVGYGDYGVVFTPPSITLTPGQTGTVVLQVNASSGFAGTIALGCTPPPNTLITCSLSQTSLAGGGTSVLTITTTAAAHAENRLPGFGTAGGISLAALLCWLLPGRNRRRVSGLLVLLALAAALQLSGCGSGAVHTGLGGGTPLGTVNLTINTAASNGTTGVSHDYSYPVTIVQ